MKKYLLLFLLFLTGCSTQIPPVPKPAPLPCDIKVNGECRMQSASEKGGPVVRGHGVNTELTP